jgi:hypothetical protein
MWIAVAVASVAGWVLIIGLVYFALYNFWYAAFGSDDYYLALGGAVPSIDRDATLDIDGPSGSVSAFLDLERIDRLSKLFASAKAGQSSSWHDVGSLREDMEDWWGPSQVTVSAGPGIRIVIREHSTCMSYDLAQKDFAAFERALAAARRHQDSDDPDSGISSSIDPQDDAFRRGSRSSDPIPQKFPGCG